MGGRFYDEIERLIGEACAHPGRYRAFDPPARRLLADSFPYALVYLDEPDTVWIVAVMHLKRKPGYWKERLKVLARLKVAEGGAETPGKTCRRLGVSVETLRDMVSKKTIVTWTTDDGGFEEAPSGRSIRVFRVSVDRTVERRPQNQRQHVS